MAKENYLVEIDNVVAEVAFVNAPKTDKQGYSYALHIKNPDPNLKPYLDRYSGIKMWTRDQSPRLSTKQTITIGRMGITKWEKDGKIFYSAHNLQPETKVFEGTKKNDEKIATPPQQVSIVQPPAVTAPNDPKEEEKKMWENKELRDFRGRAIMYATQCFPPRNPDNTISELDYADKIIVVAELRFIDYIYNGYIKPTEPNLKEDAPF